MGSFRRMGPWATASAVAAAVAGVAAGDEQNTRTPEEVQPRCLPNDDLKMAPEESERIFARQGDDRVPGGWGEGVGSRENSRRLSFPPVLPENRKQMACTVADDHDNNVAPPPLHHRECAFEHRVTPK